MTVNSEYSLWLELVLDSIGIFVSAWCEFVVVDFCVVFVFCMAVSDLPGHLSMCSCCRGGVVMFGVLTLEGLGWQGKEFLL